MNSGLVNINSIAGISVVDSDKWWHVYFNYEPLVPLVPFRVPIYSNIKILILKSFQAFNNKSPTVR